METPKIYEVKSLQSEVKDFDKKNVKIAIAHFENIDKVGEIIDRKAFDRTISISKNKWHFINHNADLFVGKFKDLYVEGDYLVAVSELDEQNANAKNLILAYEKGEINEHSIGYRVKDKKEEGSFTRLLEIDLYEGSSLTVPAANPLTPFLGFKSLETNQDITNELFELNQKLFSKKTCNVEKSLIKLKIKQLYQIYFNKKSIVPAEIETIQPQIIETESDIKNKQLLEFYKHLKLS
jgi:HK97 family phage prohead protease